MTLTARAAGAEFDTTMAPDDTMPRRGAPLAAGPAPAPPAPGAVFDQLRAAVGDEATARIVGAYGGRTLYVGAKPSAKLLELIGDDAAAALCRAMPARNVAIPMKAPAEHRRDQVITMRRDGATISQIAERFGVSERTIYGDLSADGV